MKMHIVAMRDIKANVFAQPQFVLSLGGFLRAFEDECTGDPEKSIVAKHPEDFEAYELGWYGDGDAHFELLEKPRQIAVGANYKR